MRHSKRRGPSQRQLQVGETVRKCVSEILARDELHHPALAGISITVSEVRITPDLRQATIFVLPLGGSDAPGVLDGLHELAGYVRGQVARDLNLRYTPELLFTLDRSYEEAEHIEAVLARSRDRGGEPS